MRVYVGVTDDKWYQFLSDHQPDEVNFWRPSGARSFKAVPPGGLFLFKLHHPRNFIVGGGFFVRHTVLPLSLAWGCFGTKNGAASKEEVLSLIRRRRHDGHHNPTIGCTILTEPFFFRPEQWIPVPRDWCGNIVTGKAYDTAEPLGADLWDGVSERLAQDSARRVLCDELGAADHGPPPSNGWYTVLSKARIGQGTFRIQVTEAYERRCAMTGEKVLPALQASHIKPFAAEGPNLVTNGLLLRSDLHALFDSGYLTVTTDRHIEVSRRIHEEFDNGREYYRLHGRALTVLPSRPDEQPCAKFLEWHNENVFTA
jgi:putative restriction endonuclease